MKHYFKKQELKNTLIHKRNYHTKLKNIAKNKYKLSKNSKSLNYILLPKFKYVYNNLVSRSDKILTYSLLNKKKIFRPTEVIRSKSAIKKKLNVNFVSLVSLKSFFLSFFKANYKKRAKKIIKKNMLFIIFKWALKRKRFGILKKFIIKLSKRFNTVYLKNISLFSKKHPQLYKSLLNKYTKSSKTIIFKKLKIIHRNLKKVKNLNNSELHKIKLKKKITKNYKSGGRLFSKKHLFITPKIKDRKKICYFMIRIKKLIKHYWRYFIILKKFKLYHINSIITLLSNIRKLLYLNKTLKPPHVAKLKRKKRPLGYDVKLKKAGIPFDLYHTKILKNFNKKLNKKKFIRHTKKVLLFYPISAFFKLFLAKVVSNVYSKTLFINTFLVFLKTSIMSSYALCHYVSGKLKRKYKLQAIFYSLRKLLKRYNSWKFLKGYKILLCGRFTRNDRAAYLVKNLRLSSNTKLRKLDFHHKLLRLRYGICSVKIWLWK